jgi:hypothetical protein
MFGDIERIRAYFQKEMEALDLLLAETPEDIKMDRETRAPGHLRLLVDENLFEQIDEETLQFWAFATGVDQLLFHFSPGLSIRFKKYFGQLPIPVERAGLGRVSVVKPGKLLKAFYQHPPRKKMAG